MSVANTKPLDELAAQIRNTRAEDVSLADVVRLAQVTTEAFSTFFTAMDQAVLREMREIADYITAMKREIGQLQVNDIRNAHIPAAGQELDAIVRATEAATNTIMECAEAVMAANPKDAKAYKALVDDKMMVIFEACSFQDITGQRVAKVVETLQHIESRVSRFAAAVRTHDVSGPLTEAEARRAERKAKLLLHGPQSGDAASRQHEIDALMSAPAKPARAAGKTPQPEKNSQSEIDRLFD